jgi:uncharacterized protein YhfF
VINELPPFELGYSGTNLRRRLIESVLRGEKTATASLRVEYRPFADEELPRPGQRFRLVGVDDEPVGVVETIEVRIVPARDVDADFARDEGEGFLSVAHWRAAHEQFWKSRNLLTELTDDTEVVCERFRLVSAGAG